MVVGRRRPQTCWVSCTAALALRLSHPAWRRTYFLSKKQAQLCGMFLDMPHVVEQQLRDAHLGPIGSTALRNQQICQSFQLGSALVATVLQIGLKLGFCIHAFRKQPCFQLGECERRRRCVSFSGVGEVKVEPEEGMIGYIPELRELGLHRSFAVEALLPELVRASAQGIVKHVNSSSELTPNTSTPSHIHFNTPDDICSILISAPQQAAQK